LIRLFLRILFVRAFGAVVCLSINVTVVYLKKKIVLTNISAAC